MTISPERVRVDASEEVSQSYGVQHYELSVEEGQVTLNVTGEQDDTLLQIEFLGEAVRVPDGAAGEFSRAIQSSQRRTSAASDLSVAIRKGDIEIRADFSGQASNTTPQKLMVNGTEKSIEALDPDVLDVVEQHRIYLNDFFAQAQQRRPSNARAMDAICLVAGIGTGFWPIGTMIAGPTALGCVVYYLAQD